MESHIVVTVMKSSDLAFVQCRVPERLFDNAMSESNLFEDHDNYVKAYRLGRTPCYKELHQYIEGRLGYRIEPSVRRSSTQSDRPETQNA